MSFNPKNYSCYDALAITAVFTTIASIPYIIISPLKRIPIASGTITLSLALKTAYYAFLVFKSAAKNEYERQRYINKRNYYFSLSLDTAKGMIPVVGFFWMIYSISTRKEKLNLGQRPPKKLGS